MKSARMQLMTSMGHASTRAMVSRRTTGGVHG